MRNEDTRQEIPIKITDNEDGTYTVDYEPRQAGSHSCTINYGGQRVPSTPLKFKINPIVDVSKIRVDGLEPSKFYFAHIFF